MKIIGSFYSHLLVAGLLFASTGAGRECRHFDDKECERPSELGLSLITIPAYVTEQTSKLEQYGDFAIELAWEIGKALPYVGKAVKVLDVVANDFFLKEDDPNVLAFKTFAKAIVGYVDAKITASEIEEEFDEYKRALMSLQNEMANARTKLKRFETYGGSENEYEDVENDFDLVEVECRNFFGVPGGNNGWLDASDHSTANALIFASDFVTTCATVYMTKIAIYENLESEYGQDHNNNLVDATANLIFTLSRGIRDVPTLLPDVVHTRIVGNLDINYGSLGVGYVKDHGENIVQCKSDNKMYRGADDCEKKSHCYSYDASHNALKFYVDKYCGAGPPRCYEALWMCGGAYRFWLTQDLLNFYEERILFQVTEWSNILNALLSNGEHSGCPNITPTPGHDSIPEGVSFKLMNMFTGGMISIEGSISSEAADFKLTNDNQDVWEFEFERVAKRTYLLKKGPIYICNNPVGDGRALSFALGYDSAIAQETCKWYVGKSTDNSYAIKALNRDAYIAADFRDPLSGYATVGLYAWADGVDVDQPGSTVLSRSGFYWKLIEDFDIFAEIKTDDGWTCLDN